MAIDEALLARLTQPGGYVDESLGVPPPADVPAPPEQSFTPGFHDRLLEAIYGGTQGIDFAQPHGFGESFLQGLTGSLQGQGAQVAARRAKFEANQTARRAATDAERLKATADYNKRKADALGEVAKETRAQGYKATDEARKAAGDLIPIDATMAARYPALKAFVGQSWAPERLKFYTGETPGEKATADEAVMSPRALKARVSIYRAGGAEPSFGMGRAGVANRVAFNEELAKQLETEGQTGGDVMAGRTTQAAEKANLTNLTKSLGMVRQQNSTLHANADMMLSLANKIPDTGVPLLNAIVRPGAEKVFGSSEVAKFNTALGVVQPEAARILTASATGTSGTLSDSARKELQALISGNFTKAQLRGSIAVIKRDADNRINSQQAEIDATKKRLSQIGTAGSRVPAEAPADFNFVPGKGLVPVGSH